MTDSLLFPFSQLHLVLLSICLHTLSQATDADPVGAQDFANTIGTNNDTRYKAKKIAGVATDDHPRP